MGNSEVKRNDIPNIKEKIFFQNYENLFNVYSTDSGDYFFNILRKTNFPDDVSMNFCEMYQVQHGDTWTNLAHKFYSDVKLWWIICASNKIINPCIMPEAGTILKILNKDTVRTILTTIRDY